MYSYIEDTVDDMTDKWEAALIVSALDQELERKRDLMKNDPRLYEAELTVGAGYKGGLKGLFRAHQSIMISLQAYRAEYFAVAVNGTTPMVMQPTTFKIKGVRSFAGDISTAASLWPLAGTKRDVSYSPQYSCSNNVCGIERIQLYD